MAIRAPILSGANTIPNGVVAPLVKRGVYGGLAAYVLAATGEPINLIGENVAANSGASVTQNIGVFNGCVRVNWYAGDIETIPPNSPDGTGTTMSSDYAAYLHWWQSGGPTDPTGEANLAKLDSIVQLCASLGVPVLLDAHQSSWGYFNGVGAHGGIWRWYYTDARFPGYSIAQTYGTGGTGLNYAESSWWTDGASQPLWQSLCSFIASRYYQYNCVFGFGVFNEPPVGNMGGAYGTQVNTVMQWHAPIIEALLAIDAIGGVNQGRGIHVMPIGGIKGITTGDFSPVEALLAENGVLEFHSYFNGQTPGYPALNPGDEGTAGPGNSLGLSPGDDWYPDGTTPKNKTGTTYSGAPANLMRQYLVAIRRAGALGWVPFLGEFGVTTDNANGAQYISDALSVIAGLGLSATCWSIRDSATGFSLIDNVSNSPNAAGQVFESFLNSALAAPNAEPITSTPANSGIADAPVEAPIAGAPSSTPIFGEPT